MDNSNIKIRPKIKVEETENNSDKEVSQTNHIPYPDPLNSENVNQDKKSEYTIKYFSNLDQPPPITSFASPIENQDININQLQKNSQQTNEQKSLSEEPQEKLFNPKSETQNSIFENLDKESQNNQSENQKNFPLGKFVLAIFFIISIGALIGGIYSYHSAVSLKQGVPNTYTTPTLVSKTSPTIFQENNNQISVQSPSPTAPPEIQLNTSNFSVLIKNGTGIPGEAKKVSTLLEKLGFSKFQTSNASNFNFKETEIAMKSSIPNEIFETIKSQLEKEYKSVIKSPQSLSKGQPYDIIITVGQRKDK